MRRLALSSVFFALLGCDPGALRDTRHGTIHMPCSGDASPTVVFLSGGGDSGGQWDSFRSDLGEGVSTCAFDRLGVWPSSGHEDPLEPLTNAEALRDSVEDAGVTGPLVLVGHSLGGLLARVYGGSNDVAGAVLLDPTPPELVAEPVFREEIESFGFDPDLTSEQGQAVTTWSSDAKVTVLSQDPELAVSTGVFTAEEQPLWDEGQQVYASLTTDGTQADVEGATHYVHEDARDVVMEAIRDVVESTNR